MSEIAHLIAIIQARRPQLGETVANLPKTAKADNDLVARSQRAIMKSYALLSRTKPRGGRGTRSGMLPLSLCLYLCLIGPLTRLRPSPLSPWPR
jgi:hypothetical protein